MRTAAALVAAALLTGCGSGQERAAEAAATSFGAALRSGEVERACAALAPRTRDELEAAAGRGCPRALPEQGLVAAERVDDVQRYGRQALVTVQDADGRADTWFLSRFDGRWLLVAAACRPRPQLPYDCELEGP